MKQVLFIIIIALVGFTSCSKDEVIKPVRIAEPSTQTESVEQHEEVQEPETTEEAAVNVVTYSVKNTSSVFGVFVDYTGKDGKQTTLHLSTNAVAIIQAVPGSIQAPIDVIITPIQEELN